MSRYFINGREADAAKRPRWAIFHHQFDLVRSEDGETYLTRWWLVTTPWGGIALHRMLAPDARPTLHDHPFNFVAIVLRGGYVERRLQPRTMEVDEHHHVRRFNRMRTHDAHSIRVLDRTPTWTLMIAGRPRRSWGFWQPVNPAGIPLDPAAPSKHWTWTKHDAFDSGHRLSDQSKGRDGG